LELLSNVNADFISKRHIAFVLSGLVILAGITSLVWKSGPELGIDFKGGVQLLLKYGIPISVDPDDDIAITISKSNQETQGFQEGDIIKIFEGDRTLRAKIKAISPLQNGEAVQIEFTESLGLNFTDAAVIKPIEPISTEMVRTQLEQLGYRQSTLTPSGVDEVLISVAQMKPIAVPLSIDPGDESAFSITVATSNVEAQVFQEGDRVVIEEEVAGGKIAKTKEIKSIGESDGNTTPIEFATPLEANFTAAATIRHPNVGRHIVSSLKRIEPNLKIVDGNISEVGPNIGKDLQLAAILSVIAAIILLLGYITLRFAFQFAIGAIAALVHDVLITLGLFSILSQEIDLPTVAAFLTIIGYSLNDTIVVFDRIRENVRLLKGVGYTDIINKSINQSLSRTIITSLTTFLVVVVIFLMSGPGTLRIFALALIIGVIVGTYSSIFVASPILHGWHLRLQKE